MKKILSFILAICLIIPVSLGLVACKEDKEPKITEIWDGTIAEVSAPVDGVITIETAEELAGLAVAVNGNTSFAGITIKLAKSMDLDNLDWTPIGNKGTVTDASCSFRGHFDGNGKTIKNLKVSGSHNVGLFGVVTGDNLSEENITSIKNLKIVNALVTGNSCAGALAGKVINQYTRVEISKVKVESVRVEVVPELVAPETYGYGDSVGGIIGYVEGANVTDCSAKNISLLAYRDVGGMIGSVVSRVDRKARISGTYRNIVIVVDQRTYHYGEIEANATPDVGRNVGYNIIDIDGYKSNITVNYKM